MVKYHYLYIINIMINIDNRIFIILLIIIILLSIYQMMENIYFIIKEYR